MARTNKYTSLNFNDIYEKKIISSTSPLTSPSSSSSRPSPSSATPFSLPSAKKFYSFSASTRHGGMLVLSRPSSSSSSININNKPPSPCPSLSPSPILNPNSTPPSPSSLASSTYPSPSPSPRPDSISLRPQGKTGTAFPIFERGIRDPPSPSPSPKGDKFVPPHLRPGFVAPEKKRVVVDGGDRVGNFRPGSAQGFYGSSPPSNRYGEDGRPKSGGGGHDRRMRGFGESDVDESNRPRSGGYGYRPSSCG